MLEVGGCRQDDIPEFSLTLPVAVLHHYELQVGMLVHFNPAVGLGHSADKGAAVAMYHLDRGAIGSGLRVSEAIKLLLDVVTAEAFTVPAYRWIHYDFG